MNTIETTIREVQETFSLQVAPQSYKVAGGESSKQPLTILCSDTELMQGFIACAIERNIQLTLASIKVLEQEIQAFETKYGMSSADFLRRYEEDEIPETLETIDWCFSCREYDYLRHMVKVLEEASFAH